MLNTLRFPVGPAFKRRLKKIRIHPIGDHGQALRWNLIISDQQALQVFIIADQMMRQRPEPPFMLTMGGVTPNVADDAGQPGQFAQKPAPDVGDGGQRQEQVNLFLLSAVATD